VLNRGARLAAVLVCACTAQPRVIVLGIDGLDPKLLRKFMEAGKLPNFSRLARAGDWRELQTTTPPLSPVAWSSFITGLDPGGHGIFDFVHRDPQTRMPMLSMARIEEPKEYWRFGSFVLPLGERKIEQLRRGRPFWQELDERGIDATLFRIPVNFPPERFGRSVSGMGTPDILGSPGTFSYYAEPPYSAPTDLTGGRVNTCLVNDNHCRAKLMGPPNSFRATGVQKNGSLIHPDLEQTFDVFIDPEHDVATIEVDDQALLLRAGEWSAWTPIRFEAVERLVEVEAMARFYLQQVRPLRLYVSPLQLSLRDPAMPITYPESWSEDLYDELGQFHTQGLPEDTKAFSAGILSGEEFWAQAQAVTAERREALRLLTRQHRQGFLFFYVSSVDQGSHMLWHYSDPAHPRYEADERLSGGIEALYVDADAAVGEVMAGLAPADLLIVMSDHGFSPFYWQVNLNSWLVEKGYVVLKNPAEQGLHKFFGDVDWDRTRAYALGLNGVYINLRGRERSGAVAPEQYRAVVAGLKADLLDLTDPRTGQAVITAVAEPAVDFHGSHPDVQPDLIVGYAWGYRTSWKSPLGGFPRPVIVDNDDVWSGDHSIDPRLVPGVLMANRPITLDAPALYDLPVAILDAYDIPAPDPMIGRDCIAD
jgi:predicted AlkP superfamily phosphohydrolase/phosphomutase